MSEKLGPMALGHANGQVFMGRDFNAQPDYSDEIAFQIDKEIRRIVDESYDTAEDLLVRNRALLDKLSKDLIEYETVDSKHLARLVEEYAVDKVAVEKLLHCHSHNGCQDNVKLKLAPGAQFKGAGAELAFSPPASSWGSTDRAREKLSSSVRQMQQTGEPTSCSTNCTS